jgi:hypothetical protein
VRRKFARDAPDELSMTDITEHPTREGKIYCCVVVDAFSRRVVGWSIDSTQTTVLVTNALGMATRRRDPTGGLVIHSSGFTRNEESLGLKDQVQSRLEHYQSDSRPLLSAGQGRPAHLSSPRMDVTSPLTSYSTSARRSPRQHKRARCWTPCR